jgi:formate/nitrite transporter FocA (FNT family)
MWMGAPISLRQWWLWNQLPVTAGNLVGGLLFVGLPMLWMADTSRSEKAVSVRTSDPFPEAAEA